jgi:hypothetical protein
MRKAVLAAEDIVRKDRAYLDAPLPVRMRTMIAIGPYEFASARMLVNAYPERAGVNIVWRGACDIIPQADRIAAAVGQIGVFFNPAAEAMMPPGATFVPKFEGMVNGYPRYNGWIYMTRDGRMPWVPETLGARLDRLIAARARALADWMKDPARTQTPQDRAAVQKTFEMLKKSDPAGADSYLASMQALAAEIEHKVREVNPGITRRMEEALANATRPRSPRRSWRRRPCGPMRTARDASSSTRRSSSCTPSRPRSRRRWMRPTARAAAWSGRRRRPRARATRRTRPVCARGWRSCRPGCAR